MSDSDRAQDPETEEFNWYLQSVRFSGGEQVQIPERSLCIFIGPNNSGKSSALRGIHNHVRQDRSSPVVAAIQPERAGDAKALETWLDRRFPKRSFAGRSFWSVKGENLSTDSVASVWAQGAAMPGAHAFLTHYLDTDLRLSASRRTRSINIYEQAAEQYIHVLQADESLAARVSDEVRQGFGVDLLIEWTGGQEVGFRVGNEPARGDGVERVSPEYAQALVALPRLDAEGDGIKSFVGALLAVRCGSQPLLMIDEPEAFLHPPQARRLGKILAQSAREVGRQVIVATHSADIVRGALDQGTPVTVCRITRDGQVNHAAVLRPEDVESLWSRPLLRSVGAINGLFHQAAVVCESDADIRFYEAVLASLEAAGQLRQPPDVHFSHGGGKGSLALLAAGYRAVGVPVAVIADLDLVRNRTELHNVLKALGADPQGYDSACNALVSDLADVPPKIASKEFVARIRGVLDAIDATQPSVPPEVRREIMTMLDDSVSWSQVKRTGIETLRGAPRRSADNLLASWRAVGLFLVPMGELESWWPQGPADKTAWIGQVLAAVASGSVPGASEFVLEIATFLANRAVTTPDVAPQSSPTQ